MIEYLQNTKSIIVPEGEVSIITRDNEILWRKKYKKELTYLESTGTQWIDTGIAPFGIIPIAEMKFTTLEDTKTASSRSIYGSWGANNTRFQIHVNSIGIGSYISVTFTKNTTYTIRMDGKNEKAIINGVEYTDGFDTTNGFNTQNLLVFTRHAEDGKINEPYLSRWYYYKLWNDETLLQDFIPVLDWDDRPCMYDKVSNELFYNQGTGEFLYG